MSNIYITFVDTPGIFASVIRFVLKQKYIHVVMSMDPELEEAYSIGRRNPAIPFFAGFVKEDKQKVLQQFPQADYMVCKVDCTSEQREYIRNVLHDAMKHRFRYHYTILGLPLIALNIPFHQRYTYTCSSYAAKVMRDAGVCSWSKHTSIVTPKDFYEDLEKTVIFEGPLYDLINREGTQPEAIYDLLTEGSCSEVSYE